MFGLFRKLFDAPQRGTTETTSGTNGTTAPHSVGNELEPSKQCGTRSPQCGETKLQLAERALDELEQAWRQKAETAAPDDAWHGDGAKKLARKFRSELQARADLIDMGISSSWILPRYPLFCEALGVPWPPPYKDFAKELAALMPRKRYETWRDGESIDTRTIYRIPDPADAVVALAGEHLRRAGH